MVTIKNITRYDSLNDQKTLKNQICMPLNGRVQCIDLENGRTLIIANDIDQVLWHALEQK